MGADDREIDLAGDAETDGHRVAAADGADERRVAQGIWQRCF